MTLRELAERMRARAIRWKEPDRKRERERVQKKLAKEDVDDFDIIMEYLGHHKKDKSQQQNGR